MTERSTPGGTGRAATDDDPRLIAYRALAAVTEDDAYANLVLPRLLDFHHLGGRDAAFATELAYGTLRNRGTLDAVIEAAARREAARIDPPVLDVLRLGAYQLLKTRVAAHAAVDTSVSLVRRVAGHRTAGFVNAVLRKVSQRDAGSWLDSLATGDPVADLALEFAHPEWIVREFARSLGGDDELAEALGADNLAPSVHLCARPGLITPEELAARADGLPGYWSRYAVHLTEGGDPGRIPAIADGRAHVQDEGSQLLAESLPAVPVEGPDDRWLDLCAGPGGKAALLGALAARRGAAVTAVEVAEHRAELVRKTTRGLPVDVVHADGREFDPGHLFDRVLVDAPCSGLGALRRRPEARWRRSADDVPDLVGLQGELLAAAVRLTRPGGVIAYVTCSPVVSETVEIVGGASGVDPLDTRRFLPDMPDLGPGPHVQLWPHRHGTDAMFGALLRRRD
ncbi:16S rRNA (cytosine967-C5)-methyltransferase [Stackebrandtia albiflava]|uniref:16S rRNA (Cytosine967-C5)-methyltransferase n=1 Tax=Stackebrandtia albiflava TaxID=406432 RepID=A0A562VED0_9ACTN|nr:transcription antitermination factor NusB [Stackebrandtia albiflava]TWJ16246.1 16S rRNA (cytosine967-C5)-methyltransferase [Stackebrandtia albiflava]